MVSLQISMNNTADNITTHWENVYQTKDSTKVSWYEDSPQISIDLIKSFTKNPEDIRIIDVGGGASKLVDFLVDRNYKEISVLDIASTGLNVAKDRLGRKAMNVKWIVGNILQVKDFGPFDIWHDRAVFHFLTNFDDQQKYAKLAKNSIAENGYLIIGTFDVDGPEKCSQLSVSRYNAETLSGIFTDGFKMIQSRPHIHSTPSQSSQSFIFVVMQRCKA